MHLLVCYLNKLICVIQYCLKVWNCEWNINTETNINMKISNNSNNNNNNNSYETYIYIYKGNVIQLQGRCGPECRYMYSSTLP